MKSIFKFANTRKPSYRWQTHATRKPAKIAPIWRAYNDVADTLFEKMVHEMVLKGFSATEGFLPWQKTLPMNNPWKTIWLEQRVFCKTQLNC